MFLLQSLQLKDGDSIKCVGYDRKAVNFTKVSESINDTHQYYYICAQEAKEEKCPDDILMSITMINDKETKLCADSDDKNLKCYDLGQYAQTNNEKLCKDNCQEGEYYWQQITEMKCYTECPYNYYVYNETIIRCTQNNTCKGSYSQNNSNLIYLDGDYCVEKCTTELYYKYNENITKCSYNDHCDEKSETEVWLTYVTASGECVEKCTNFQFVYNDKFTNCTSSCDNIKTQNETALPYGDQTTKLCVEKCEYNWFYANNYQQKYSNQQCTTDKSCESAKQGQSRLRYFEPQQKQCVDKCDSKYRYNYYTDDDSDTIKNLYACARYNDSCNESMAFNGTEMKYLRNSQTDICIDNCPYTWWYQKLNTTVQVCVDENNTKCNNLKIDEYYYTSGNAEDYQCIVQIQCKENDQCFYYKSINKCQQFSEIEEYSTYIVQSTEDYRCVEDCNEDDYFYLSESENNQKICVESCSELSNEYQVQDNSKECVKGSKSDDNKSNTGLIVGIIVAVIVVIVVVAVAIVLVVKKRTQKQVTQTENAHQQMIKNTQNIYI